MVLRLGQSRMWWALRSRHSVAVVIFFVSLLAMAGSLTGCYFLASGAGHLDDYHDYMPPISALGAKMPEQLLFVAGLLVSAVSSFVIAFFRSASLDEALGDSAPRMVRFNFALFVIVLSTVPMLILTGCVSMDTPQPGAAIHLICAGFGLGLTAFFAQWTAVIGLYLSLRRGDLPVADPNVPRGLRIFLYVTQVLTGQACPILFAVWVVTVVQEYNVTILEYVAASLVYLSMMPWVVFFAYAASRKAGYHEIQ